MLYIIWAILVGLILGSFYNVCILRYLAGESILFPPSHCPHCKHQLAWFDLVPILSFVFLRGKCRYCHAPISVQYPIVEMASGLVAGCLAWKFGMGLEFFVYLSFSGMLFVLAGIDLRSFRLPDCMTLPGLVAAIFSGAVLLNHGWGETLGGALAGYGILWIISSGYKELRKRDGIGKGDMKLLAMIGALVGISVLPWVLALAAIMALGVVFKFRLRRESRLPFGPWLSMACILQILVV